MQIFILYILTYFHINIVYKLSFSVHLLTAIQVSNKFNSSRIINHLALDTVKE